jgi:hypothetical protein
VTLEIPPSSRAVEVIVHHSANARGGVKDAIIAHVDGYMIDSAPGAREQEEVAWLQ